MSAKIHLANSVDPPPTGNVMSACKKLQLGVTPMTGELHQQIGVCSECISICVADMPENSVRRYVTYLMPLTKFKPDEPEINISELG